MNLSTNEASAFDVIQVSQLLIEESMHSPFPDTRKWAASAVWNLIKCQMMPVFWGNVSISAGNIAANNSNPLDALTPDFDKMGKTMGGWM